MEAVDVQSDVVIPQPTLLVQEGGFDAFFADAKVVESLSVGTDGVRSHAEQIPGFRPRGMYYHRDGDNYSQ